MSNRLTQITNTLHIIVAYAAGSKIFGNSDVLSCLEQGIDYGRFFHHWRHNSIEDPEDSHFMLTAFENIFFLYWTDDKLRYNIGFMTYEELIETIAEITLLRLPTPETILPHLNEKLEKLNKLHWR